LLHEPFKLGSGKQRQHLRKNAAYSIQAETSTSQIGSLRREPSPKYRSSA
jgi:hypothetical protein